MKKQRVIVENAFGFFKMKFKRFTVPMRQGEKQKFIKIMKTAMLLHNFIIDENIRNK